MRINLNDNQKKAVEYVDGHLLIVAGPGTGKTRVLTEKVVFLVNEKKVEPKNILVSTFCL